MQQFYDTCESEDDLRKFLESASLEELNDLIDTINYHIFHDDMCSPIWEYKEEIAQAIQKRNSIKEIISANEKDYYQSEDEQHR